MGTTGQALRRQGGLSMSMSSAIVIHPRAAASSKAINALRDLPTSVIGDVMGGRLIGTTALRSVNRSSVKVCGNAVTVRVRSGDNLLIHKALDLLEAGQGSVQDFHLSGHVTCELFVRNQLG